MGEGGATKSSKENKFMDIKDRQRNNFKYRNNLILRITKEEFVLKSWFEFNKIRFMFQKGFLKPFHRIADFYIPNRKLIIEVDGGYHELIKKQDELKDFLFKQKRGMKTIRIKNEQIWDKSYQKTLGFLKK